MKHLIEDHACNLFSILLGLAVIAMSANAQSTTFTYQGRLTDAGTMPTGTYQMEFRLFDALSGGTQVGPVVSNPAVSVTEGVFSANLNFGAPALSGADRFLQVAVRRNAGESFIILNPRQQITSSPYSIRTLSAAQADVALDANRLGGINASEYVTTTNGGNSFIRNSTTQQATSNFNISGNGSVGGSLAIGPTTPSFPLTVRATGHGMVQTDGIVQVGSFVSSLGGWLGTRSNHPLHFFTNNSSPLMTVTEQGNVGMGTFTPGSRLELRGTDFGVQQRLTESTSGNSLVLQGGSGENMKVTGFNYGMGMAVPLYLSVDGANTILNPNGGSVGIGTTSPTTRLDVRTTSDQAILGSSTNAVGVQGFSQNSVGIIGQTTNPNSWAAVFAGRVRLDSIPVISSFGQLCFAAGGTVVQCGASSLKLKSNVQPFQTGLDLVRQMRPISFDWKDGSGADIGLAAEDVARIAPSFALINQKGEVQGVKYERLNIVLINAVKQQQEQIEQQRKEIEILKKIVCAGNVQAEFCRQQ